MQIAVWYNIGQDNVCDGQTISCVDECAMPYCRPTTVTSCRVYVWVSTDNIRLFDHYLLLYLIDYIFLSLGQTLVILVLGAPVAGCFFLNFIKYQSSTKTLTLFRSSRNCSFLEVVRFSVGQCVCVANRTSIFKAILVKPCISFTQHAC